MPPAGPPAGAKGDWEWLLAVAQAPARPISPPAGLATGLVAGGRYLFKGIAASNTATAAGLITVVDGTDSTGVPVFYLPVGASTANNSPFLGDGILCEIGLYIVVTGLAGKVTIWAAALHDYPFTPPGE